MQHDFNEYITKSFQFQGSMNAKANSIELMINGILEKINIESPTMLGPKIVTFNKNKKMIANKYSGNFEKLIIKLEEFNRTWNITKHGMIVGGLKELTLSKNGQFHTFDQNRQAKITSEFTEVMMELTKIHEAL